MSRAVHMRLDKCLHVLGLDSLASSADMADAQVLLSTFQDGFPLIDQLLPVAACWRSYVEAADTNNETYERIQTYDVMSPSSSTKAPLGSWNVANFFRHMIWSCVKW
jgi:hypothetical protein